MSEGVLEVRGLKRSFEQANVRIDVLRGVDLAVAKGEIVALLGPSGSGKSTLLQAVGLLEGGFEGSIRIAGEEVAELNDNDRTRVRRDSLGFVYQFHHLLPDFNAVENVVIPQLVRDATHEEARQRAESLLTSLGLGERLTHRPSKLSGGEQQRVAVARALANRPALVLADEPTGNLDADTGRQIMSVLEGLHRDRAQTIVMVTHDRQIARTADRVLVLKDGRLSAPPPLPAGKLAD